MARRARDMTHGPLTMVLRTPEIRRLNSSFAWLGSWQIPIKVGRTAGFTGRGSDTLNKALKGCIGVSDSGTRLHLGPVIAILTVQQSQSVTHPFAAQTSMLSGFIQAAQKLGTVAYVLTPQVLGSGDAVLGWYPDNGQWQTGYFPYPDVVYDRIPTRRAERQASVRQAKHYWQNQAGCAYFGVDFLDKWQVHQAWSQSEISEHIPDTLLYEGTDTLIMMLERHERIYIKPCSSSLGLGVARIMGTPQGSWLLSWRQSDGSRRDVKAKSPEELTRQVETIVKGRPFLVQQGIDLITYQQRLFDIRVAVQRDGWGQWQLTGAAARVGFARSIVTNMAAGAVARPVEPIYDVLSQTLHTSSHDLQEALARVALGAAEVLGRAFGPQLGELGLDLAIDQTGDIWILEANSKPLRTVFQELDDQRVARLCLDRPMEYARYLAGFDPDAERLTGLGKRGENVD